MYGLDNSSGVSTMPPIAPTTSTTPLWFTEGGAGQSPSWPGQDWYNMIQAELLNVVTASGITPSKAAQTQVAAAIKTMIANSANVVPVGVPQPWPGATPPDGWLKCNGAGFDIARYPLLAKAYPSGRLPDLRGEFIRGWDDGRGIDSGRTLLTVQPDLIKHHSHATYRAGGSSIRIGQDFDAFLSWDNTVGVRYPSVGAHVGSDSWSGTETRPRNVAFNYIVRAA